MRGPVDRNERTPWQPIDRQPSIAPVRVLRRTLRIAWTRACVCSDAKITYVDSLVLVSRPLWNTCASALALGKPVVVFSRRACQLCPPLTRPRASVPAHRLQRHLLGGYGDSVLVFRSHFPLVLRHLHEHCAMAYTESMYSRCMFCCP